MVLYPQMCKDGGLRSDCMKMQSDLSHPFLRMQSANLSESIQQTEVSAQPIQVHRLIRVGHSECSTEPFLSLHPNKTWIIRNILQLVDRTIGSKGNIDGYPYHEVVVY